MPSDREAVARTWSDYWASQTGRVDEWDALSEVIFQTLKREAGTLEGKSIMEAGCGTGRISAQLAREGASVTCLDIVPAALEVARAHFDAPGLRSARFIEGSVLSLPRDESYDIVWNAGLLEHFGEDDQRLALAECVALLKPGGRVIALTPYARSIAYRVAKCLLERIGKWPYGRETPVRSLRPVVPAGARLLREYTVSFLPFLLDCHKFIRCLRAPCRIGRTALTRILGRRGCAALDRLFSRVFGGYLLVSVLRADQGP